MATDERFDELIGKWLQETAPAQIPERVLEAAAERTRATKQQRRWRGLLRSIDISRSILALGTTAAVVVAAIVALSPRVGQPEVGQLPTTPDAWSRVSIDSRWVTAQVDGFVAGPRGLLAILGQTGSHDMQLSVSTDGRTWTLVPNDQFPSPDVLWPPQGGSHLPAVVTPQGFLFVADGNDVWASADGKSWQRRADRARDDDLRAGTMLEVAAGGPGLVAVGSNNTAWYSEDGSDWTLAEVPAPPTESFAAQGYAEPMVDMIGVTVAGDRLVAWGNATAAGARDATLVEPVLWTSDDGRSWTKVSEVSGIGWLQDVAAGPDGFIAIAGADPTDDGGIWFSADSRVWQPADGFESAGLSMLSIAGSSAGYVASGGEGVCDVEPCPGARAVIWTSPDGMTWSRMPDDDRFEVADPGTTANHSGAWATNTVAWDAYFVVAGAYDTSPVVWISDNPTVTQTPVVTPAAASDLPSPILGVWISTSDADGGVQRMTVERAADDAVEIAVTDTMATVCSGISSTMTGSGSIQGDRLVIPTPEYRCDDGTEATTPEGPPLNEQLRDLTYTYDEATDTLSVGIGDVWRREETTASTPAPQPSEPAAPTATSQPSVEPGSFEPIAGEIRCGNHHGTWTYPATAAQLNSDVLGCSRDGGRVIIQKGNENLFVLNADGSETQATEQLSGFSDLPGSGRPVGATISPDGSRVVFAGLTRAPGTSFCHYGALFAVDADGGQAELLWESQAADNGGIVRDPTFSPDGTRIAFADGYCDHRHSVWVMNADGSDPHQIFSMDEAGHVYGLAWSPSGDRIALKFAGVTYTGKYTFAPDGSDVIQDRGPTEFCWPGQEC